MKSTMKFLILPVFQLLLLSSLEQNQVIERGFGIGVDAFGGDDDAGENSRNARNSWGNIPWRKPDSDSRVHGRGPGIGHSGTNISRKIGPGFGPGPILSLISDSAPWPQSVLPKWKERKRLLDSSNVSGTRRSNSNEAEELLLADEDEQGDTQSNIDSGTNNNNMNNVTTMPSGKTKASGNDESKPRKMMMDMDQIMNDMGVWNNRNFQKDDPNVSGGAGANGKGNVTEGQNYRMMGDSTLSTVKIIPDEHHVSAFLNKGISKRFLFLNDKFGNPLSITITPCTSILQWNVKFWPVTENGTQSPEHVKTYRTQRTVTFTEPLARRGVYAIDIKAIHWDSYAHFYATSFHPEPIRVLHFNGEEDPRASNNFHEKFSFFNHNNQDKFYQHIFSQAEETGDGFKTFSFGSEPLENPLNLPAPGLQTNTNANINTASSSTKPSHPSGTNKPRIWVKRLRGNRLQVKWDTSPINPHLMNYCIVVNTRRDYSSLCSASGERFGVLPPDLMHVTYYGPSVDNSAIMIDKNYSKESNGFADKDIRFGDDGRYQNDLDSHPTHHKFRHQQGNNNHKGSRQPRTTHEDIVIGCLNKKTHYILNNLRQGRLYYFNVFLRDLTTNVSYPYVRTTLRYQIPKNVPNCLRDAKPVKVKLTNFNGDHSVNSNKKLNLNKPTTMKFNLNKPCSELTMYVMPCGGGSIRYEALHGNKSVYESSEIDSLDVIKIAMPQRGKYFIKIYQASTNVEGRNVARMAEVYVGKKPRRFPLPKLPAITRITEDESSRNCDSVTIQWWPSPDPRDNEYCIFLKEENRKRIFQFKKPNQCDVERSLKSDPYVTHSLCLQRPLTPDMMLLSQKIVGLQPGKTYVIQLIVRRHNGKSLSYDLHHAKTLEKCIEN